MNKPSDKALSLAERTDILIKKAIDDTNDSLAAKILAGRIFLSRRRSSADRPSVGKKSRPTFSPISGEWAAPFSASTMPSAT